MEPLHDWNLDTYRDGWRDENVARVTERNLTDIWQKLLAELLDIKTKLDDAVKIAEHADSAQLARSYDTLKNAVAQASVALAEQEDRLAAAAVAEDDEQEN